MHSLVMRILTKFIAAFFAEAVLTDFLLMLGEKIVKSTMNDRDDEWFKKYKEAIERDPTPY